MSAQRKSIYLIAKDEVIVDGVKIPPGRYSGYEKRIAVSFMGRDNFLDPEYELELTSQDVKNIPGWENMLGATLEATDVVASGLLEVD